MSKIRDYIIAIFLAGCSIFYIPSRTFSDAQIDFFKIGVCALLGVCLFTKPIRFVKNSYLNIFLLMALISLVISEKQVQRISIGLFVGLFLAFIIYYIIANYLENRKIVYKTLAIILTINLFVVILQFFKMDPICLNDTAQLNTHLVGLFGYKMNMGSYAAMCLPLMIFCWPVAIIAGILVIASKSFGAIIAAAMGIMAFLYHKSKKIFYGMVVAIFIIALFLSIAFINSSENTKLNIANKILVRTTVWKPFLSVVMQNPYKGYGLGTFPYIYTQVTDAHKTPLNITIGMMYDACNDYLETGVNYGVGGIIILLLLIYSSIKKFIYLKKDRELMALFCSLVTIAVGMMFHSYMNFPNIGVMSLAILAMFDAKIKEMEAV